MTQAKATSMSSIPIIHRPTYHPTTRPIGVKVATAFDEMIQTKIRCNLRSINIPHNAALPIGNKDPKPLVPLGATSGVCLAG